MDKYCDTYINLMEMWYISSQRNFSFLSNIFQDNRTKTKQSADLQVRISYLTDKNSKLQSTIRNLEIRLSQATYTTPQNKTPPPNQSYNSAAQTRKIIPYVEKFRFCVKQVKMVGRYVTFTNSCAHNVDVVLGSWCAGKTPDAFDRMTTQRFLAHQTREIDIWWNTIKDNTNKCGLYPVNGFLIEETWNP